MKREQKLQLAKDKLNTYQRSRKGYSLQNTLSNTTINGQPLQGLGVSSTNMLMDDNASYRSLSSFSKSNTGLIRTSSSQGLQVVINDFDKLNIHDPK
jgi:hypothetical protein